MSSKKGHKKARRSRFILVMVGLLLGVLVLLLLGAFAIHKLKRKYDLVYEFNRLIAEYADKTGHYETARSHYLRALEEEPEHPRLWYRLGEICGNLDDAELQEEAYQTVLSYDPDYALAYTNLIQLYEKQERLDAIYELMQDASEDMLPLFFDYQVEDPVFSPKSGEFDCSTMISFENSEDYEIYYTLDGTDPCEKGKLFTSPILLDQDGIYQFKAVSRNMYGFYSKIIDGAYVIDLAAPEQPHVSPEGGNFAFDTEIYISVPKNCTGYYTWDGSKPDRNSKVYTSPIAVPEGNHVLSVIAIDDTSGKESQIFTGYYVYYLNQ